MEIGRSLKCSAFYTFTRMKIKELRKLFTDRLNGFYSPNEINAIFRFYCEDIHHLDVTILSENEEIPDTASVHEHLTMLTEGKPLQYITGIQWFLGLPFSVNENVLIPRPETEELVEWVVQENQSRNCRIIDIGTGSGCMAVTLAKLLPEAEIWATDISDPAIGVAAHNASVNNVKVHFVTDDILQSGIRADEKFDIIVSNPPYIPLSEADSLESNVRDYEPHLALFAPSNDPLLFYKAILRFADIHLRKNGVCYFEIHKDFSKDLYAYFESQHYTGIKVRNDMSGNVRMIKIQASG